MKKTLKKLYKTPFFISIEVHPSVGTPTQQDCLGTNTAIALFQAVIDLCMSIRSTCFDQFAGSIWIPHLKKFGSVSSEKRQAHAAAHQATPGCEFEFEDGAACGWIHYSTRHALHQHTCQ